MSSNFHKLLNKVLLEEQIVKNVKNKDLKQYLQTLLLVKNIFFKFAYFIVIGLIVMGSCFITRQIFIDNFPGQIYPNPGISFSAFANASNGVVYLIQAIPCVLTFLFFIFLNDKYIYISLLVIFFGGMSNIVDRALPLEWLVVSGNKPFPPNAVVDYIPFVNTYCNLPDIFIITGCCFTVLFLIISLVKIIKTPEPTKSQTPNCSPVNKPNESQ